MAGHNYLIPVDAALDSERDLDFEAISLDFVLKQMEVDREGKTNIVFLDACRDNPLGRNLARSMGTRSASVGKGLAEVQTGVGTFIAYSTQPGNVALDGQGRNSPFTAAFAAHVQKPGRNLTAIMIDVRKDVLAATGGRQVPWDHSALTSDFYFQPVAAEVGKDSTPPTAGAHTKHASATTIADLDALAAAQNWGELHDRLTDISPASRDAHWNGLVEQAALGELAAQSTPGGSTAERLAAIARYYPKFSSLGTSAKFLALRSKIGLEAFSRCFNESSNSFQCRDDLERFVDGAPASAELALGAAHLVGLRFNRQAAPLFYAVGLDAPGGKAICTDSGLQYDLIVALQLPADYREAKAARAITERCWESVKTVVAANLAQEVGESYYLQNACPSLIQHHSLTGLLEKRCQAVIKQ
jgi:Caspase domain